LIHQKTNETSINFGISPVSHLGQYLTYALVESSMEQSRLGKFNIRPGFRKHPASYVTLIFNAVLKAATGSSS